MQVTDHQIEMELLRLVDEGILALGWDQGGPLFWATPEGQIALAAPESSRSA